MDEIDRINAAIAEARVPWGSHYQRFGEMAPGHRIVGQILAVLPEGTPFEYVDARLPNARQLAEFECEIVIFTSDLLLRSTVKPDDPEGDPELAILSRSQLTDMTLLAAPPALPYQGYRWDPYGVLLDYPRFSLRLPFDPSSRASSERLGALLPSLVRDIIESRG